MLVFRGVTYPIPAGPFESMTFRTSSGGICDRFLEEYLVSDFSKKHGISQISPPPQKKKTGYQPKLYPLQSFFQKK